MAALPLLVARSYVISICGQPAAPARRPTRRSARAARSRWRSAPSATSRAWASASPSPAARAKSRSPRARRAASTRLVVSITVARGARPALRAHGHARAPRPHGARRSPRARRAASTRLVVSITVARGAPGPLSTAPSSERAPIPPLAVRGHAAAEAVVLVRVAVREVVVAAGDGAAREAVSYTHLTLPTILLV